MGFTKLDQGIVLSSIAAEDSDTFKVWIFILALCGPDGVAPISSIALPGICHLPAKTVERALRKLQAPDPHSRSKTDQGRRVKRVDGGFYVTNYLRYRAFNYSTTPGAVRTRKWREKAKRHGDVTDVTGASRGDAKPVTVTSRSASASALCFSSLRERGKGESKKGVNHRDADDDTNLDKALEEARADEPRLDAELERKMKAA